MENMMNIKEMVGQYLKEPEAAAEQLPPESEEQREAQDAKRKKQARNLGLIQKEDGKISFNANQCVEHMRGICDIVNLDGVLRIYNRASGLWEKFTEELLGMLLMFLMNTAISRSWRSHYETEVMNGLERCVPWVMEEQLSEELIPLENGVYDISKKALRKYAPEDLFQSKIPVAYDENADCHIFKRTVDQIFESDKERIAVMQEIFGNALLNSSKAEKLFLWIGMGSNGKSLLGDILTELIGHDNTAHVPLSQFGETFGLEPIIGKMLNLSAENEVTKKLHTEYLKAMASGDTVSIPRKFKTAITEKI